MRRPVLTLLLLASFTFFLGLGRQAITDGDEAYYAEASREMVESGDWLTPHFNYEYRWEKPVLYYWLTSAVYIVTGPTEAAARIWSALAGLGLVLLTFAIAQHGGASLRAAWLAAAITATCFGYFAEARLALPDLPLTFCVTLMIWATLRVTVPWRVSGGGASGAGGSSTLFTWWALAGLAAGLGFLMKGPVALVVPAVVLIPIWWRERSASPPAHSGGTSEGFRLDRRGAAVAFAIFLVVGLPWYAAMTLTHGRAYLDSFFLGDNLERFATTRFAGRTSSAWWFYGPVLLGGLMPWTAYAMTLIVARFIGSNPPSRRWQFTTPEWRLIVWAVMPLLFFTASVGKQPRYILPVLPPVAILLAGAIHRRVESASTAQRSLMVATLLTAVVFGLTGVLLMRARPLFITSYAPITTLSIALLFAWAAALAGLAISRQWKRLPIAMTVASATLVLAFQFGALAGARPEPVERMARLIRAYRVADEPVGQYQVFVRNLVFYARFRQSKDLDESTAAAFLNSSGRVFLVVRDNDLAGLRAAGARARELGRVDYVDTAKIRLRTLLWPDPTRDIETIVLVTNE